MAKEFNLKEKRKELLEYLYHHIDEAYKRKENPFLILQEVENKIKKQDKEFIRLLKEEFKAGYYRESDIKERIDKLSGGL